MAIEEDDRIKETDAEAVDQLTSFKGRFDLV